MMPVPPQPSDPTWPLSKDGPAHGTDRGRVILLTFLAGVTDKWNALVVGQAERVNDDGDIVPDGISIRYEETEAP